MINKRFSERLHKALDNIDVPFTDSERVEVLSKLLSVRKFKAEELLRGNVPDRELLEKMALELEVSSDWLIGKEISSPH